MSDASPAHRPASLAANLAVLRERIDAAATMAGRPAPELVAVTKTVGVREVAALHGLGLRAFGENRVSGLREKVDSLVDVSPPASSGVSWHFIGHLQRNKARRALELCSVLHSVDSPKLADTVVRIAAELRRPIHAYVEVNLTDEEEKHGCSPEAAIDIAARMKDSPFVTPVGIMVMGPLETRPGSRSARDVFDDARALADSLAADQRGPFDGGDCRLSMGMSGDFEVAIACGTDVIRVGSALFDGLPQGDRP